MTKTGENGLPDQSNYPAATPARRLEVKAENDTAGDTRSLRKYVLLTPLLIFLIRICAISVSLPP